MGHHHGPSSLLSREEESTGDIPEAAQTDLSASWSGARGTQHWCCGVSAKNASPKFNHEETQGNLHGRTFGKITGQYSPRESRS